MNWFFVSRTLDLEDPKAKEILAGASLITNDPYWAKPGAEAVVQPLAFRNRDYAIWCKDIAANKDKAKGDTGYAYAVEIVELKGFA